MTKKIKIISLLCIGIIFLNACSMTADTETKTTSPADTKSVIKGLEIKNEDIWLEAGAKGYNSLYVKVTLESGCRITKLDYLYNYIEFVSTNTNVATVKIVENKIKSKYIYSQITVVGNGQTQIYAKTLDGKIISNKIKLSVGNEYNKKECINKYIENYVYYKLKYPYKIETVLNDSEVIINDTTVSGNTAAVKGYVNTFDENGAKVRCNYDIQVQFDAGLLNYTVVSEKYSNPELIKEF